MKKLLIMCGAGIATSTVVIGKVKEWLVENKLDDKVKIYQGKVAEEVSRINEYDIVISTTLVPENCKDKVINGLCLLTGMGKDEMFERLKAEIEG